MRAWLYRFMAGRYGKDEFGIFILIFSYILFFISIFTGGTIATLLYYIGFAGIILCIFRMLSRNVYKRRQENYRYLKIQNGITGWFRRTKNRIRNSKTHRYFRCPGCSVTVRVPRGRGKIEITCPKCRAVFTRKS